MFGPTPPSFRFCGRTIDARELVALATACDEVAQAQVAVTPEQRIQLRVRLTPDALDDHHSRAWVRFRVLEHHLVLADCVAEQPEAFDVVTVDRPLGSSSGVRGVLKAGRAIDEKTPYEREEQPCLSSSAP
ncbi:hypothetical protein ACFQ3Z_20580 [Streptomyces nogalater]